MVIDIYLTCKDTKEAKKIAIHLLKKRLIACANIFPVKSLYWWKGKLVKDAEVAMLIKAPDKNLNVIEREIKKIHSYTVPCISFIEIHKVNNECGQWINKVTK